MITEKLYENDSHIRQFSAVVLDCIPCGDKYKIVLDRTAFFPEGGGQIADIGHIDGVQVFDVQEEKGTIYHYAAAPFEKGSTVEGEIDWDRRFSCMQNHSGEHIISGIIHSKFGYNNVGFHLSEDIVTLDVDGGLTDEDIALVEKQANAAVFRNLDITISYPTSSELETLEYRSKLDITENVRIVTIGDVDKCACCAPHVKRTGEIGLIKIVNYSSYKGGMRIEMLCGFRALADYDAKNRRNAQIVKLLAVPSEQTPDAVQRTLDKVTSLNYEIKNLKDKLALANLTVENINGISFAYLSEASFDELRSCIKSLADSNDGICITVADDSAGCIFIVTAKNADIQPFLTALRSELKAKGGGKNNYAQGKIPCSSAEVKEFIGRYK